MHAVINPFLKAVDFIHIDIFQHYLFDAGFNLITYPKNPWAFLNGHRFLMHISCDEIFHFIFYFFKERIKPDAFGSQ